MKPADHQAEFEQLMACLDGELTGAEAATVRGHVAECPACQAIEAELRAVAGRLSAWEVDEPPARLTSPAASSGMARVRSWMPVAAALVITAGAGAMWLGRPMEAPPPARTVARPAAAAEMAESIVPGAPTGSAAVRLSNSSRLAAFPSQEGPATTLLARSARLVLVVPAFDHARSEVERITAAAGGFIGNVTTSENRGSPRALSAILRVPAKSLDTTLAELKRLGRSTTESRDAEDVTQQSVDLDARLANARTSEKRLNDILANRTGSVSDVLDVEREIARVRGEIEQMEATRTTLDRRISYGTIQLDVTEEQKAELGLGEQSLPSRLRNAVVEGWNAAFDSLLSAGVLVARVAPTVLLWGLALLVPYRLLRRRFSM